MVIAVHGHGVELAVLAHALLDEGIQAVGIGGKRFAGRQIIAIALVHQPLEIYIAQGQLQNIDLVFAADQRLAHLLGGAVIGLIIEGDGQIVQLGDGLVMRVVGIAAVNAQGEFGQILGIHIPGEQAVFALGQHIAVIIHGGHAPVVILFKIGNGNVGAQLQRAEGNGTVNLFGNGEIQRIRRRVIEHRAQIVGLYTRNFADRGEGIRFGVKDGEAQGPVLLLLVIPHAVFIHHHAQQLAVLVGGAFINALGFVHGLFPGLGVEGNEQALVIVAVVVERRHEQLSAAERPIDHGEGIDVIMTAPGFGIRKIGVIQLHDLFRRGHAVFNLQWNQQARFLIDGIQLAVLDVHVEQEVRGFFLAHLVFLHFFRQQGGGLVAHVPGVDLAVVYDIVGSFPYRHGIHPAATIAHIRREKRRIPRRGQGGQRQQRKRQRQNTQKRDFLHGVNLLFFKVGNPLPII